MTAAMPTVLRIPRFRATRSSVCSSDYACDDIEIGDRVGLLAGPAGPTTLCAGCCDRVEAAAALDPVTFRTDDDPPPAPTCVAEAVEALQRQHADDGQYDDEHVAALLALIDDAAEHVARRERELWAWRLRQAARGSSLSDPTKTGLRMAASLIERNRSTP